MWQPGWRRFNSQPFIPATVLSFYGAPSQIGVGEHDEVYRQLLVSFSAALVLKEDTHGMVQHGDFVDGPRDHNRPWVSQFTLDQVVTGDLNFDNVLAFIGIPPHHKTDAAHCESATVVPLRLDTLIREIHTPKHRAETFSMLSLNVYDKLVVPQ